MNRIRGVCSIFLASITIGTIATIPSCDAFASNIPVRLLNSNAIATRAMKVAQSTRTTGRCYGAVCRALHPLGVNLSGSAAYQARPLLLNDHRFVPLVISNVNQLRRGDIIVYERSSTHPYGHISVYEGDYVEASDHVSPITHTQNYGKATVFRLASENSWENTVTSSHSNSNSYYPSTSPYRAGSGTTYSSSNSGFLSRSTTSTIRRALVRQVFGYLLRKLGS